MNCNHHYNAHSSYKFSLRCNRSKRPRRRIIDTVTGIKCHFANIVSVKPRKELILRGVFNSWCEQFEHIVTVMLRVGKKKTIKSKTGIEINIVGGGVQFLKA